MGDMPEGGTMTYKVTTLVTTDAQILAIKFDRWFQRVCQALSPITAFRLPTTFRYTSFSLFDTTVDKEIEL